MSDIATYNVTVESNEQTVNVSLEGNERTVNVGMDMSINPLYSNDHTELANRDVADQHPISAITGLEDVLDTIPSKVSELQNDSGYITSASVPTKVSQLTNDSGFISTETDPTVPSWAKSPTKPSYTANEVGALPSDTVIPSKTSQLTNDSGYLSSAVTSFNGNTGAVTYSAPVSSVNGQTGAVSISVPSKTSDLQNDSGFITGISSSDVTSALGYTPYNKPSSGVPKTDLASSVQTSLGKADTALQSFTETDPTVPSWAKASSKPSYTASEVGALPDTTAIPSKTSDLTNDSGYITTAMYVGTCSSGATETTKVVTCSGFTLFTGASILVTFSETNSGAVADLKLNVNNTGAKSIKYINNGTRGNLPSAGYLKASTTYLFIYDGTYWVAYFNYNTTYSGMTSAEITAGTGTTNRLITPANLKTAIQTWENVHSVNGQTGAVSLTIPTVPTDVSSFNNDAGYLTLSTLPVWDGSVQ